MHVRLLLFTVVSALIVAAPARAAAPATLPHRTLVGPAQGVQASVSGKTVTIRFTGASAAWGRKRAGQEAFVTCAASPEPGLLFRDEGKASPLGGSTGFEDEDDDVSVEQLLEELGATRLSRTGASVKAKLTDPKADLCEIRISAGAGVGSAWAVLTPRGVVALEEQQRGLRLADVIYAAAPKHVYRSAADVVALGGGEVVALDDPNGTPPAGKIGYWSKGRAMSVVSASATGRRLAIQDIGGGMLRTNAFGELLGWSPAEPSADSERDTLVPEDDQSSSSSSGSGSSDSGSDSDEDEELSAADGLFSHLEGDEVVFRFTGKAARAYRRVAGQRALVMCMKAPERPLLGEALSFGTPSVARVRVPAHGGVIRGRAPAGRNDVCSVMTTHGREVAFGMLTPAGRRYMMDFVVPLLFIFDERTPWSIAAAAATSYPGAATYVAAHPGVVALPSPGAALAAGKIGIWTDASQQALIALGAPDGHRYLIADEGAGQMRTNAFSWLLGMIATASSSSAAGITNLLSVS